MGFGVEEGVRPQGDVSDAADESLILVEFQFVEIVDFLAEDEFPVGTKTLLEDGVGTGEDESPVDRHPGPTRSPVPSPNDLYPFWRWEKREEMIFIVEGKRQEQQE